MKEEPLTGVYYFRHAVGLYPIITFSDHALKVEILNNTEKSYLVKFLDDHPNGKRKGATAWVAQRKIKLNIQRETINFYGRND